jgi:formylglycine-generating enzyme required for sulfatase activity
MMGDLFGDGEENEKPVHQVTLSAFKMSKHEITNEQYCAFLNADPGRNIEGSIYLETSRIVRQENRYLPTDGFEKHPVVGVTWYGAKAFCDWMGGRLPTEAQWEYAARAAGDTIKYPWGNEEPDTTKANFSLWWESPSAMKPVGSYPPNGLGLFDMAGNAWEWCYDWYGKYSAQSQTDPEGAANGASRVVRGGAFRSSPGDVRCAVRLRYGPGTGTPMSGFAWCCLQSSIVRIVRRSCFWVPDRNEEMQKTTSQEWRSLILAASRFTSAGPGE